METKNIYAYNPKETEQASVFSKLMRNVYRWMTFALAITGLTAACVAGNATLMQFILGNQAVFLGLIIAELVVAFTLIGRVSKLSFTNASLLFILYSILTGATLSTIFLVYEIGSIASTFFVTAGTFGAMSLVGYFTQNGNISHHGTHRTYHRNHSELVYSQHYARLGYHVCPCARFCRTDGIRYPKNQGHVA